MTLVEAAEIVERLERRAATPGELQALQVARDALLTIVSEGFQTIGDRLRAASNGHALEHMRVWPATPGWPTPTLPTSS